MTGRVGQVIGDELWLRCPHCGDSEKHPERAHYSVNSAGLFFCVRCRTGGRLTPGEYVMLLAGEFEEGLEENFDWRSLEELLLPGPGNTRSSALERFHLQDAFSGSQDVFLSRDIFGETVGLVVVSEFKKATYGAQSLGFSGDQLLSSPDDPIRIVEGPYDVLSSRDVCVFGLPSKASVVDLVGHYAILCPDGDVWGDRSKRDTVMGALVSHKAPTWVSVEVLDSDKDPDEVPDYNDRRRISPKVLVSQWRKLRRRQWISRLLESSS